MYNYNPIYWFKNDQIRQEARAAESEGQGGRIGMPLRLPSQCQCGSQVNASAAPKSMSVRQSSQLMPLLILHQYNTANLLHYYCQRKPELHSKHTPVQGKDLKVKSVKSMSKRFEFQLE